MTLIKLSLLIMTLAGTELSEIREIYFNKIDTKEGYNSLSLKLSTADSSSTINGYKAALKMNSAQYEKWPFSKLSVFNEGKNDLQELIEKDKKNTELRLIRLSIQENAPRILGYNDNIEEDREFINKQKPKIKDSNFLKHVDHYLNRK